jgi:hypothetical protein
VNFAHNATTQQLICEHETVYLERTEHKSLQFIVFLIFCNKVLYMYSISTSQIIILKNNSKNIYKNDIHNYLHDVGFHTLCIRILLRSKTLHVSDMYKGVT